MSCRPSILVVDDDEKVCRLIGAMLDERGWEADAAHDVAEARGQLVQGSYELVLCDVGLPDASGLDLLAELAERRPQLATVMVTGRDDPALAERALELGAYGYVTKPFRLNEIVIQVSNALRRRRLELESRAHQGELERTVAERTADLVSALAALRHASAETITRLAVAIEFRDTTTGEHVSRVGRHAHRIARRLGLDEQRADLIRLAAPLHDVGKVAVRDEILLKRGPLTPQERLEMQRHTEVGHEILSGSGSELLELGAEIAWSHHERWDGSGYPRGLAGEEIPLAGRIVAAADVFDALASDRPYRARLPVESARACVIEQSGAALDPAVVAAFFGTADGTTRQAALVGKPRR